MPCWSVPMLHWCVCSQRLIFKLFLLACSFLLWLSEFLNWAGSVLWIPSDSIRTEEEFHFLSLFPKLFVRKLGLVFFRTDLNYQPYSQPSNASFTLLFRSSPVVVKPYGSAGERELFPHQCSVNATIRVLTLWHQQDLCTYPPFPLRTMSAGRMAQWFVHLCFLATDMVPSI